jgi:hypothetical protein
MSKILFQFILVLCLVNKSWGDEAPVKKKPLFDRAVEFLGQSKPEATTEVKKVPSPKSESVEAPAAPKEAVKPPEPAKAAITPEPKKADLAPQNFEADQNRFHFSLGFGNLALKGNSRSVLEENYSPASSAALGLNYEILFSKNSSFQTGLNFLVLGSDLKLSSSTELNLSYLAIPLIYKRAVAQIRDYSNFYLMAGAVPLVLLNASVDTCSSLACGNDAELDAWLTERRSETDSLQRYSLLGNVGAGFNFLLFKEFIINSLWLTMDLSYSQSLTSINKGNKLGSSIKIEGAQGTLGLAIAF